MGIFFAIGLFGVVVMFLSLPSMFMNASSRAADAFGIGLLISVVGIVGLLASLLNKFLGVFV